MPPSTYTPTLRTLGQLVELCSNWDKDERYMALNDLWRQLQRDDLKTTNQEEVRVVDAILKALTDVSNDVKSAAVKCVAAVVKKVGKKQITEICKTLCQLVRSTQKDQAELRDIYSIALRTLIEDVPDTMGDEVSARCTGELLEGVGSSVLNIKRECLMILDQLLKRFGTRVSSKHEAVMTVVLPQLGDNKSVRRAAADTLSSLALVASDPLLDRLVTGILDSIEKITSTSTTTTATNTIADSDARTLIQTMGTIAHTVGHRLGRHLARLVPLFLVRGLCVCV
eukprot:GSChrysophyteH2.ASY1.ANO1.249.1 assembled CDS